MRSGGSQQTCRSWDETWTEGSRYVQLVGNDGLSSSVVLHLEGSHHLSGVLCGRKRGDKGKRSDRILHTQHDANKER